VQEEREERKRLRLFPRSGEVPPLQEEGVRRLAGEKARGERRMEEQAQQKELLQRGEEESGGRQEGQRARSLVPTLRVKSETPPLEARERTPGPAKAAQEQEAVQRERNRSRTEAARS